MLLSLMRQFSYRSLAEARAESGEILRLLEIEALGTPERMTEGGEDAYG